MGGSCRWYQADEPEGQSEDGADFTSLNTLWLELFNIHVLVKCLFSTNKQTNNNIS